MSAAKNGGPAFPAICKSVNGIPLQPGMTLRDYFAAHASITMQDVREVLNRDGNDFTGGDVLKTLALLRLGYADEMIAVREKKEDRSSALSPTLSAKDWIEWGGGWPPVEKHVLVEVRLKNGSECKGPAAAWNWSNSEMRSRLMDGLCVVAYRVAEGGAA